MTANHSADGRYRHKLAVPTRLDEGPESAPARPIHGGASGNTPGSGTAELTKLEIRTELERNGIAGSRRIGGREADARRIARVLSRSSGATTPSSSIRPGDYGTPSIACLMRRSRLREAKAAPQQSSSRRSRSRNPAGADRSTRGSILIDLCRLAVADLALMLDGHPSLDQPAPGPLGQLERVLAALLWCHLTEPVRVTARLIAPGTCLRGALYRESGLVRRRPHGEARPPTHSGHARPFSVIRCGSGSPALPASF